jgi:hypothetical protein
MKKTSRKTQSNTAVLYPPPFHPREFDEPVRISYTTGKRRTVSPDDVADGLEQLAQLAALSPKDKPESIIARHHFYDILEAAVARMNQLARKEPTLWSGVAETVGNWPVNYSKTPMARRRADELLNKLNVGKQVVPRVHTGSRVGTNENPSQAVVIQVFGHIIDARGMPAFYLENKMRPAAGWRRDALELELPADTAAKRAAWKRVAEAVLREGGYDASRFGTQPKRKATTSTYARKESYPRSKFWQVFDGLLKDAGKLVLHSDAVTT